MSDEPSRTLMFGDVDAGLWGVVWAAANGGEPFAIFGAPEIAPTGLDAPVLDGVHAASAWRLSGDGFELAVVAESDPAALAFADVDVEGFDQLCQVRGRVAIDGAEHQVECLGRRGTRLDRSEAQSVRDLAAWFGEGEGLALVSLRYAGTAGHDADAVSATLFEDGRAITVADPRLSSTYAPDGTPTRAGLELWLEETDAEEETPAYPRRATGEAVGQGAIVGTVRAELFRWHMRGLTGTGMYQLIRHR